MTAQNDYTPWAIGVGANTLSVSAFKALTALVGQGFQAGVARSDVANTAFRQVSSMCSMLGEFIRDAGYDALDNGDIDTLEANFIAALRHYLLSQETALLHYGVDTGTANHIILATPTPAVTALADGMTFLFTPNVSITGATDFVCGSLPAVPLKRDDGTTALAKGDLVAGRLAMAVYAGGVVRLVCQVPDVAIWHQGSATGGTSSALTTALTPAVGNLVPHVKMRVPITTANAANATLDFGFGAKPIVLNNTGVAVAGGEMPGGVSYEADLQWDGTSLRLMNPLASGTPQYTGATDSVAGAAGVVPGPPAGGQRKVPLGTGAWGDVPTMVGASGISNGKGGAVPQPNTGDQLKFLRGDGQWVTVQGNPWGVDPGAVVYTTGTYLESNVTSAPLVGKTMTAAQLKAGMMIPDCAVSMNPITPPTSAFNPGSPVGSSDARYASLIGNWICVAHWVSGVNFADPYNGQSRVLTIAMMRYE